MANEQNLKSYNKSERERAVRNGKKGGIQTAINNKKRKSYKELFNVLQDLPVSKDQTIVIYEEDEQGYPVPKRINLADFIKGKYPVIPQEEINNCIFATMKMIELINHPKPEVAMKAFEIVRDTSGQRPEHDASNVQNNFFGDIAEKVGEATKDLINVTPKEKKKDVYDLI